ncbi:MAG: hypothetical protein ACREV4_03360 [Gammaproteobacteria bacterium]
MILGNKLSTGESVFYSHLSHRFCLSFLLGCLCFLDGCASMQAAQRQENLDISLNTYLKLIRWGHFDTAAQYIRHREKEGPPPRARDNLEGVRVTFYEVLSQGLSDNQKEALVAVTLGFYDVDSGIVHRFHDRQMWWFDEAAKRWFLDGDLPDFGAAMRAR